MMIDASEKGLAQDLALKIDAVETTLLRLKPYMHQSTHLTKLVYSQELVLKARRYLDKQQLSFAEKLTLKANGTVKILQAAVKETIEGAESYLHSIEEDFAAYVDAAKGMFEATDFEALKRLHQKITSPLAEQSLGFLIEELGSDKDKLTSDVATKIDKESTELPRRTPIQQSEELQSFKHYQSMFEKMALDRLLTRVMKEIPENAGPLNPERLVIRAFKALQDISPEYLSRLLAYYESLLTLQLVQASEK